MPLIYGSSDYLHGLGENNLRWNVSRSVVGRRLLLSSICALLSVVSGFGTAGLNAPVPVIMICGMMTRVRQPMELKTTAINDSGFVEHDGTN